MGQVPLERALSKLGIASRSQTKLLLSQGRIKVNGRVIHNGHALVVPEKDKIIVDGKAVVKATPCMVMLNKPKGYVTTKSDEKNRKTVFDLLPKHLHALHSVGRLDMHTSGLLLLTNDTQLSSQLTDPNNGFEREYVVTVKGRLGQPKAKELKAGIVDDGELLKAEEVHVRKISNRETHLIVTLTEGKNREIRRMFKAMGHEVTALKRIRFAQWTLRDLPIGQYKLLPLPV